jgi:hypothetical protein
LIPPGHLQLLNFLILSFIAIKQDLQIIRASDTEDGSHGGKECNNIVFMVRLREPQNLNGQDIRIDVDLKLEHVGFDYIPILHHLNSIQGNQPIFNTEDDIPSFILTPGRMKSQSFHVYSF